MTRRRSFFSLGFILLATLIFLAVGNLIVKIVMESNSGGADFVGMQAVNEAEFSEKIKGTDLPVVVDFWAPWCGPCRTMGPILESLAQEMKGQAVFLKVNVDDNRELASEYGIRSIPTLIFFMKGKNIDQTSGVTDKEDIIEKIEKARQF